MDNTFFFSFFGNDHSGETINVGLMVAKLLLQGLLAGVLGLAVMVTVMRIMSRLEVANADMVRAIGSFVTKDIKTSFPVGLGLHAISAVIFAVLYAEVLKLVPVDKIGMLPTIGLGLGFVHGVVVSAVLIESIADLHPLPAFQKPGLDEAFAHVIGHGLFGLTLGCTYLLLFGGLASFTSSLAQQSGMLTAGTIVLLVGCFATYKFHQTGATGRYATEETTG